MPRHPIRDMPSPDDGALSEANSSVQVHLDASSIRGQSTSRSHRTTSRRRSPSRNTDQPSIIPTDPSSQSSGLSSSHQEHLAPEDVLRDLITTTESSRNSVEVHGLKRPHDGESVGEEPSPKRDKLGEELEQMAVEAKTNDSAAPGAGTPPVVQVTSPSPTDGSPAAPATAATRRVLPMRAARRQSSQPGSGRGLGSQNDGEAGPSSLNPRDSFDGPS